MRNSKNTIFDSAVVSPGATSYSSVVDLSNLFGYSAQLNLSGASAAGTAFLQGSNDNVTFVKVLNSDQAFAAAGNILYEYNDSYFQYFRVGITASGTTTVSCIFFAKGV